MMWMWSSRIFSITGRLSFPPTVTTSIHRNIPTTALTAVNANAPSMIIDASSNAVCNSPYQETRRFMSKYLSKSATKRLPLNTKRAKKGYYKGKGCTSEGRLTSKGKFIADPLKKLQLIVPDLEGFPLKPYIAKTISKYPPGDRHSMVPES
ncbi:hypothetical protein ACHAXS_005583 [Conticribra weissflogii]